MLDFIVFFIYLSCKKSTSEPLQMILKTGLRVNLVSCHTEARFRRRKLENKRTSESRLCAEDESSANVSGRACLQLPHEEGDKQGAGGEARPARYIVIMTFGEG